MAASRREAERLCREIVRVIGLGKCAYCWWERMHSAPGTDVAHVLSKQTWPAVRYDLENFILLCRACHDQLGSARLVGYCPMRDFYIFLHGRPAWEDLLVRAGCVKTFSPGLVEALKVRAAQLGIK